MNRSIAESLLDAAITSKGAVSQIKRKQLAPGQGNYQYLTSVGEREKMYAFNDFLLCNNSQEVVPAIRSYAKDA